MRSIQTTTELNNRDNKVNLLPLIASPGWKRHVRFSPSVRGTLRFNAVIVTRTNNYPIKAGLHIPTVVGYFLVPRILPWSDIQSQVLACQDSFLTLLERVREHYVMFITCAHGHHKNPRVLYTYRGLWVLKGC